MTPGTGSLELAHARIAARWGARADEALWRRIETTRALEGVLALVRCGPLAGWVGGLDAEAGPQAVDAQLRAHWQAEVAAVAAWLPEAWQPALRWCATGIDLPLRQHRLRGGAVPAGVAVVDTPVQRHDGGKRPGAGDAAGPPDPAGADTVWPDWLATLRRLLPEGRGRATIERQLLPLAERHLQAFGHPAAVDGWALRRQFADQLVRLWRRHPAEPVGGFIHLVLTALEGERLRGELVRRAAFPAGRLAA